MKSSLSFLFALVLIVPGIAFAQGASGLPANIDSSLQKLLAQDVNRSAAAAAGQRPSAMQRAAVRDSESRVRVNLRLDGKASLEEVRGQLAAAGAKVTAENKEYRGGVLTAFVPLSKVSQIAQSPGVLSMSLSKRPIRNIGATTSGGVFPLKTDTLNNQGINGTGATVGVLSDSYDAATQDGNGDPLTIHAAQDIQSGDLPGAGNPNGNTTPVNVIDEILPVDGEGFDEGRAMLQIVHDIAPKAALAFATAFHSEVSFANNIRRLRTEAGCNVIVDDVFYTTEPFFSDGIIAQAVDDVATSDVLAGPKASYFSSAGNQQGGGYTATFTPVSDATARAGIAGQNVNLAAVPSTLTSGGFHNFNPGGATADISQSMYIFAGSTWAITFQWNDPFDKPGGVTTDYNILVFDADGNYLPQYSGTAVNTSNQQPIEDIEVENTTGNDAYFQVVIARAGTSPTTPVARKLRYLIIDEFGSGVGAAEYYQPKAPATFGHSCATNAVGVAAYVYDDNPSNPVAPPFTPVPEDFTSQGPSTIDFDAAGNRLASSQIRQRPDLAAPDGGNTTFFGFDYEGDGFPNFFGTSAAAPHAAGVAALLQDKANNGLTPAQVRADLKNSVLMTHDIDPFFSEANLAARQTGRNRKKGAGRSGFVKVTGLGNSSNASSTDVNFFTITLGAGGRGETLESVTIALNPAGLEFDSTVFTGFPFTLGKLVGLQPSNITTNVPGENESIASITLFFARGTFVAGDSVSFGIDRDFIGDGAGNGADLLEGASVTANTNKTTLRGTFENTYGSGWTILDGVGFINAVKAASFIP